MAYLPTSRVLTNIDTNQEFRIFDCCETDNSYLLNESTGEKIKNFYCVGNFPTDVKLNDKSIKTLTYDSFIEITKERYPTHTKNIFQKRFRKLKLI